MARASHPPRIKKSPKRAQIKAFDRASGSRQTITARFLRSLRQPARARNLNACNPSELCADIARRCRVCSYFVSSLVRENRSSFFHFVCVSPQLGPWIMLVAVPSGWHRAPGALSEFDPARATSSICRRLARSGPGMVAVVGIDITANSLPDGSVYWAPHVNILLPAKWANQAFEALASLCPRTHKVPCPLRRRAVDDPWVAFNYACKIDLSLVIARSQVQGPRGLNLKGPARRLDRACSEEFLSWRLGFDPADLVRVVGIRRPGGTWQLTSNAAQQLVIENSDQECSGCQDPGEVEPERSG